MEGSVRWKDGRRPIEPNVLRTQEDPDILQIHEICVDMTRNHLSDNNCPHNTKC